jgi:monofunctional glycosyltransferase
VPRARSRSIAARAGWFIGQTIALFVITSLLWVIAYRFVAPPVTFTMIGNAFGGHSIVKDWMPLSQIDRTAARAAIAGEDGKFCAHGGFDRAAIESAWRRNQQGGHIRGGSTISQQTAKNVFLWQGGGFVRKGLEAWFTLLIEQLWGKPRIMEVYLNVAETGIGTYGVNAASQRYFGHDAHRLTPVEAARIIAVLPLPKARDASDPGGYTRRYGNAIAARARIVSREHLDDCVAVAHRT